jgi:hypothetical protein
LHIGYSVMLYYNSIDAVLHPDHHPDNLTY